MYQALYRKYRPMRFEDVVGQEHITDTLRRQVASGRTSHAYVFVGSRGTGKTTCAKIFSRAVNCENPQNGEPCNECESCRGIISGSILDVVEIDAASNNGVDSVRAIRDEAIYSPTSVRKRVYIIDEVHMLSTPAFNALLKIMEEPPEHLVFILATTELNKVPATILSRTQRFNFKRLTATDIEKRLRYVCDREKINITPGAVDLLARLGDGAMRDALSLLDQCLSGGEVTEESVLSSVGIAGSGRIAVIFKALKNGDASTALRLFEDIYASGADPGGTLGELLSLMRDMLISRVARDGAEGLITGTMSREALDELSDGVPTGAILKAADKISELTATFRDVRDRRTAAEVAIVRLSMILGSAEFAGYDTPAAPRPQPKAQPAPVFAEKPAERPAEKPVEGPVEKPAERPVEQPAERPVEQPAERPAEKPPERRTDEVPPEVLKRRAQAAAASAAAPEASGDEWERILAAAKSALGTHYPILSEKATVAGVLRGGTLTVHTGNPFTKMMVDNQEVKSVLASAAGRVLGRAINVVVTDKPAENREGGGSDKLDSLGQFGNIVTFK